MNEKDNEGKLGNPEVLMDFYQGRTTNCLVLEGKELLRKEKKKTLHQRPSDNLVKFSDTETKY